MLVHIFDIPEHAHESHVQSPFHSRMKDPARLLIFSSIDLKAFMMMLIVCDDAWAKSFRSLYLDMP